MNWAHVHLMLNHLPVIGMIFAFGLLIVSLLMKNQTLQKVVLGVLVFTAITAIPVYLTGEPAEEVAEHLPGVTDAIIERHEDFAKFSLIAILITGALAAVSLLLARGGKAISNLLMMLLVALSLVTVGLMGYTANLGGEIRHTEIRATNPQSTGNQAEDKSNDSETEKKRGSKDDD
ncbi:MAG: DUF2231 domain-containing protein [Acidobacteriota bacterium]